ncbi:hypothetical protein [Vreelandella sp. EE27]
MPTAPKQRVSTLSGADIPSRQRVWEVIRTLTAKGQSITQSNIQHQASRDKPLTKSHVSETVRALLAGRFLERINGDARPGTEAEYRLVNDVGAEAPRVMRSGKVSPPPGREQMWRTMKIIGEFSAASLAEAASTPQASVATTTANEYCVMLAHADYLSIVSPAQPGRAARYRLAPGRWTGPMAPQIRRTKEMYDPNTGTVIYSRVTKTEGGEP